MVAAEASGLGDGIAGVAGMGEFTPSAMGSSEMEKLDVDAVGVGEKGENDAGGFRSCSCSWPSRTDCFRAWGCVGAMGRVADLASGDGTRGEVGATVAAQQPHTSRRLRLTSMLAFTGNNRAHSRFPVGIILELGRDFGRR